MAINATKPTVLPAEPAKTYDVFKLSSLNVMANNPAIPVRARAILQKARVLEDGSYELSPNPDDSVTVVVKDWAEAASKNQKYALVQALLLDIIQSEATAQGLI